VIIGKGYRNSNRKRSNLKCLQSFWTDQNGTLIGMKMIFNRLHWRFLFIWDFFDFAVVKKRLLKLQDPFVGPALDFKINSIRYIRLWRPIPSESVRYALNWGIFHQKPRSIYFSKSGFSFQTFLIESGTLQGPGIYEFIFQRHATQIFQAVTSDRKIAFWNTGNHQRFQARILARPDDCQWVKWKLLKVTVPD